MSGVSGLRVALVNWRDPWHPAAGGAEVYAWELARRLAARGARPTYVTARAPGQARRETVEGVVFLRTGGRFTVYPKVLAWLAAHRRRFDVVVDCQNGIPFFTPWVLPRRVPVFCSIFHVHDAQFALYFPRPLAWLGRVLEGPVARWSYRRHACTAISLTTVTALRERLAWTGPVYVVPVGVNVPDGPPAADVLPERGSPELVCVTRLVPHKRVERIVDLAADLRAEHPGVRVRVVGRGPEEDRLRRLVDERGLADAVTLHGFVSEGVKTALVARADLHLSASHGEGWGLCATEAAALGVPTVAYDVDGLRDAVRDGTTGWLVSGDGPMDATVRRALKELAADPGGTVAEACRAWAREFDWERTTDRMAALLAAAARRGTATADPVSAPGSGGADDSGAMVVRRYGDPADHPLEVAEGPHRDELLASGAAAIRAATPAERLLGRALPDEWPAVSRHGR